MSVVYSSKCARRADCDNVMTCVSMIDVINGKNVIYARGHPSRRARKVTYGIYGQVRGKSVHISMP